jgi:hypothetical protein
MFVELAFYLFTHVLSAFEVHIKNQRTLLKLIMFKTTVSEISIFQAPVDTKEFVLITKISP